MKIVQAIMSIKPSYRKRFLRNGLAVKEQSEKENGNINFSFYEDAFIQNRFISLHTWESEEALKNHMVQPHVQEMLPIIENALADAAIVNIFDIKEMVSEPISAIKKQK